MQPLKDTKPTELFAKLLEMPAPSEVVDFPRYHASGESVGRIRIQAVTGNKLERCRKRALDKAREKYKWQTPEEQQQLLAASIINDMVAREILADVCVSDEPVGEKPNGSPIYAKIFNNPDDMGELLRDEIAVLYHYFEMVQAKFGPVVTHMSSGEIDAWVSRLVEGGSEFPLSLLDLRQQERLTLSLAQRLCTLCRELTRLYADSPDTLTLLSETLSFDISCYGEPRSGSAVNEDGLSDPDVPITLEMASELARQHRVRDGVE